MNHSSPSGGLVLRWVTVVESLVAKWNRWLACVASGSTGVSPGRAEIVGRPSLPTMRAWREGLTPTGKAQLTLSGLVLFLADSFDQSLDTRIGRERLIRSKIGYFQMFRNCEEQFEGLGRFLLGQ